MNKLVTYKIIQFLVHHCFY